MHRKMQLCILYAHACSEYSDKIPRMLFETLHVYIKKIEIVSCKIDSIIGVDLNETDFELRTTSKANRKQEISENY